MRLQILSQVVHVQRTWGESSDEFGGRLTCTMNRIIGFLASKCTGFMPSKTPACGATLVAPVGTALAMAVVCEAMLSYNIEE